jgi:RimJ/RimL family protein N-acetyltransferase
MNDSVVMKFIESSSKTKSKNDLINYLNTRINKDSVRFFGIFSRETRQHIGNIKYEPIDFKNGYAVMGVLIGDKLFRGDAVFGEVYSVSSQYIVEAYGVNKIYAGVDSSNLSAIRAYEKNGFVIAQNPPIAVSMGGFVLCNSS